MHSICIGFGSVSGIEAYGVMKLVESENAQNLEVVLSQDLEFLSCCLSLRRLLIRMVRFISLSKSVSSSLVAS